VGFEPSSPVQTDKLFIPRSDKNYKNDRNAEARYMAGTPFPSYGRGFDSHRPLHKPWVRPGHIGNRSYRTHGLHHFWTKWVV